MGRKELGSDGGKQKGRLCSLLGFLEATVIKVILIPYF